jgi:hypothetical protein
MKFILSKAGITLLVIILTLSYGLYEFYTTGITGGRTGRDAVRGEDSLRYYLYMIFYTVCFLLSCGLYIYFIFSPPTLGNKKKHEKNEDEYD